MDEQPPPHGVAREAEMKVTQVTKDVLASRRQERRLLAAGYRKHETDWEILRGFRWRDVIVDAVISVDGKHVWTKIGAPQID
jgi:hypothetical protein